MNTTCQKLGWAWFLGTIVLCGVSVVSTAAALGQEPAAAVATTATDQATPAADSEATDSNTATTSQAESAASTQDAPPGSSDPAKAPVVPDGAPANNAAAAGNAPAATASKTGLGAFTLALIIFALFALPILIGNYLAKQLKMPDYGWKIALVLGTLAASILIITFGKFKFGPDLAGGITLVYELADTSMVASDDQPSGDPNAAGDNQEGRRRDFDMSELINALKERIDPAGTREVTIREYGPAIEIIIPETGPDQIEYVKRRITDLGQLEFRITADPSNPADRAIIEQARLAAPSQKNVLLGNNKVAEWVQYSIGEFGPVDQEDSRIVKRLSGDTPEALVLMDSMDVTGEYLTSATKGVDERGGPAVNFSFDRIGAQRFKMLTSENKPNSATGAVRYLGIILDKRLISAPSIRTTISNHGQISGGAMNEEEVDFIIGILNAGSLPAALNKNPISEEVISPTLGAVTVEKGKIAIAAALFAVMLFMIVYYRFAGLVACVVLTFNLLLVLAIMVLINAAFTLPGLAGLVLTIGMSVDANVLIYERIREELKSGAALRMAIRNGFGRAMSAIVDSNVTTIISGIALYAFATDQIKGFAITLILGILTSMFTAIFCARLIFDIGERRGWIKELKMMRVLSEPNFDFLSVRWLAGGLSLALITIGLIAAWNRGKQLLDIDFTGGSSVTFTLQEEGKLPISEVRRALLKTPLADKNLLVVERGEAKTNTRFSIDTSEQSVNEVKLIVEEAFAGKLLSYHVEASGIQAFSEGDFTGTEAKLAINSGPGYNAEDGVSYDALMEVIKDTLTEAGLSNAQPTLTNPDHRPGSVVRYKDWTLRLGGLDQAGTENVLSQLQSKMNTTAMFPLASQIGGRVSGSMQIAAIYAMLVSLLGVTLYLWVRFQKVTYGLAAAAALVHDVLVTIGMLAISSYIVSWLPGVAAVLKIDSFQIGLTIVAALLTIMGYSLNDTIVTFDRLREIKGKSPKLTAEMVNRSVNQTLSRTILTALTVFLVIVILYFFGGDGIHGFAFAFLVGTIAGTYSTIYIAAPVLLWLSGASVGTSASEPATAIGRAG